MHDAQKILEQAFNADDWRTFIYVNKAGLDTVAPHSFESQSY